MAAASDVEPKAFVDAVDAVDDDDDDAVAAAAAVAVAVEAAPCVRAYPTVRWSQRDDGDWEAR